MTMEGIRLFKDRYVSEKGVQEVKKVVKDAFEEEDMDVAEYSTIISAHSFLNEFQFHAEENEEGGTKLALESGASVNGIIVSAFLLFFATPLVIIPLIFWLLKINDVKKSIRKIAVPETTFE